MRTTPGTPPVTAGSPPRPAGDPFAPDQPSRLRWIALTGLRAIHLSRLHWCDCDAVPRLAGWCPVPAFARRVPVMVRHGRGLLGLSGVAALAGRVRLPTM